MLGGETEAQEGEAEIWLVGQAVGWVGVLPQIVTLPCPSAPLPPASHPASLPFPDWLRGVNLPGFLCSHLVTNRHNYLPLTESSLQVQMWL